MRCNVSLRGMVVIPLGDLSPEKQNALIESHLDGVMTELDRLHADDSVIELDLNNRSVLFAVTVEAPNPLDAIEQASSQIRSAIHAAGGGTPDWPHVDDTDAWGVRLEGVSSELVEA